MNDDLKAVLAQLQQALAAQQHAIATAQHLADKLTERIAARTFWQALHLLFTDDEND